MKQLKSGRRLAGFTLIELMVVVLIVGILSTVAYPSYSAYVVRANRRSAQSAMMDIGNLQQQYLLSNRVFASKDDLTSTGYSLPADVATLYDWTISVGSSGAPSFTVTLTPKSGKAQASDGTLALTNLGVKTPADKW